MKDEGNNVAYRTTPVSMSYFENDFGNEAIIHTASFDNYFSANFMDFDDA